MPSRRLTAVLALSISAMLAGCSPSVPPIDAESAERPASLNEVRETADALVEEIMAEFPDADADTGAQPALNIYHCVGEEAGIGRWFSAFQFATTDIRGGIESVRETFSESETSYGTSAQDIEYADGSTWPVLSHHLLLEDETGSYLLTYSENESGFVQARVITACGELR